MAKEIQLTQGRVAIVDDVDYEWLSKRKWGYNGMGYAVRWNRKQMVKMHREIMNAPSGMDVDHINGNGLDNRRSNLRVCSHAENQRNMKIRTDNTSGHRGVSFDKSRNKWYVYLNILGERLHIGRFDKYEDAVEARNQAATMCFGEFNSERH